MGQNTFVQVGAILLLVVAILVGVKACKRESPVDDESVFVGGGESLSEAALAGLGIEGDTERDVVATLIGEVRTMKDNMGLLRNDNAALRADNADLKKMEQTIGRRLASERTDAEKKVLQQSTADVQTLMRRLDEAERQWAQAQRSSGGPSQGSGSTESGETVWVQPLGSGADSEGGLLASLGNAQNGLRKTIALDDLPGMRGGRGGVAENIPYFTIPRNATLVQSTAMTALVGRVPIGGQVTDPYSFKVIIGRENLMANGIELPDVAYSIASGKAVGDWTLGCVRGDLYSITFVFRDGTIRTVPKADDIYEGTSSQREFKIGELSDAYGNPCVVGERITNAYTYLAQRMGVVTASAAAEAAAASQTTQITSVDGSGTGVTTVVDGSTGQYILGRSIADGSMEVARWLDERQAQQFDAIYVPPGADIAMHITEQIEIDYDPNGRKTNYAALAPGGYRELD
ncbi:MAG: integrating conjugative element protein (TIGR03752 family) [Halieaceae bacterium]|jgi:integrating conjugative element protein (TIGR03752 family)